MGVGWVEGGGKNEKTTLKNPSLIRAFDFVIFPGCKFNRELNKHVFTYTYYPILLKKLVVRCHSLSVRKNLFLDGWNCPLFWLFSLKIGANFPAVQFHLAKIKITFFSTSASGWDFFSMMQPGIWPIFIYIRAHILRTSYFSFSLLRQSPPSQSFNFTFNVFHYKGVLPLPFS